MSGCPSTEDVAEICIMVAKSAELREKISRLRKIIGDSEEELKVAGDEYLATNRSIVSKMEHMDVLSNGNYGWQHRSVLFLTELYVQITGLIKSTEIRKEQL